MLYLPDSTSYWERVSFAGVALPEYPKVSLFAVVVAAVSSIISQL